MNFVWNDGGRAESGFVGSAGDCVTRAIAIATGRAYRDIYQEIGERTKKTPRNGVPVSAAAKYLEELGWQRTQLPKLRFVPNLLPQGAVILHLEKANGRSGHFCTMVDHVVHDTWNPGEDECYFVASMWTTSDQQSPAEGSSSNHRTRSREQELTQDEFEKIMRRLRALDNTANNHASTEGEKRNALRMMQTLMLKHNLGREDIIDKERVEHVQFTRMACPLNGKRACTWEKSLAWYVVHDIFPTVQWYMATRSNRTWFWFYGPLSDVENCIALFRELLLTIATFAQLQYGGASRGSGASYAEGYVAGLPRFGELEASHSEVAESQALIHDRALALHRTAKRWLALECDVQLGSSTTRGRYQHDDAAAQRGKKHGASQKIATSGRRPRITHR